MQNKIQTTLALVLIYFALLDGLLPSLEGAFEDGRPDGPDGPEGPERLIELLEGSTGRNSGWTSVDCVISGF